jgi:hypothetical protein
MVVASSLRASAVLVGGVLLVSLAYACSSSGEGPSGGGGANANPEPLFRAIEADLKKTCGGQNGSCHIRGTYQQAPTWLAEPDAYQSAKKYRGILPATKDVSDSIILTQVDHAGPSLKRYKQLYDNTAKWLLAELPPPPLPATPAFSVATGYNQVNLNTLGSGLDGAKITFLATDVNGVLTLSALRLQAPNNANVKVESPFFVILPRSGKVNADPDVNGFKGELTVPAGTSAELFGGKMILLRWDPTGQLKIVFQKIESSAGQAANSTCTALDVFMNKAVPGMRTLIDQIDPDEGDGGVGGGDGGAVVGKNSCIGCHAAEPPPGEGPSPAVNAMDLRGIDGNAEGQAHACGQARNWINFQNKPQSTILLNPQGKVNPNHPIRPLAATDPIIKGIEEWVNAEK